MVKPKKNIKLIVKPEIRTTGKVLLGSLLSIIGKKEKKTK